MKQKEQRRKKKTEKEEEEIEWFKVSPDRNVVELHMDAWVMMMLVLVANAKDSLHCD